MHRQYLTAHQVAEMLQLNVESIYELAKQGGIPGTKICGRWRFDGDEIHEWFRTSRRKGNGSAGTALVLALMLVLPAGSALAHTISGRVFEDVDFTGTPTGWDGGGSDVGLPDVDVELYTSGDGYLASATTDGSGQYSFTGVSNGSYKVRVRSATIGDDPGGPDETEPASGFDSCAGSSCALPLPEMTWGNGPLIGGQDATVDDTTVGNNAGPGDTWTAVNVSGADVPGVDMGFSYELIVNTVDDNVGLARSRQGSFRQFLKNVNASGGTYHSRFAIPQSDPGYTASPEHFTIQQAAIFNSFTWLTNPVILDGTTQAEYVDAPIVELRGLGVGSTSGLVLESGAAGSVVRGFVINNNGVFGISVGGDDIVVAGNYIGTDVTGTLDEGNDNHGILVNADDCTIGGLSVADRNVISGNGNSGVEVNSASRSILIGNYIGTDKDGLNPLGNDTRGIGVRRGSTIGGSDPGARNVISANGGHGIEITAGSSVIRGNYIGIDAGGTTGLGNSLRGVNISGASNNTIGGLVPAARNVISANGDEGVMITGSGTTGNLVVGNYIGTDESAFGSRTRRPMRKGFWRCWPRIENAPEWGHLPIDGSIKMAIMAKSGSPLSAAFGQPAPARPTMNMRCSDPGPFLSTGQAPDDALRLPGSPSGLF